MQHTKNGENIPNNQKGPHNIPNGHKINQITILYTNIFYCKTLQNLPKFGFLVWKYAIWHPCLQLNSRSQSPVELKRSNLRQN
jgi:hypothetical protein